MENLKTRRSITELSETYGDELLAAELALEERMVTTGRDQIRKQIARAREAGQESGTKYGQTLIAMSVDKVAEGVRAFIEKAKAPGAGRRHVAVRYLEGTDPEVAAYIAMRCVVDSLTGKRKMIQRVAVTIGSRIEDDARFAAFEDADKKAFNRAQKRAKSATSYQRKTATMAGFERRYVEDEWNAWPEDHKLHVGMAMIDMVLQTGLVTLGTEVTTRKDTVKVLQPTAELMDWIERENAKSELLSPAYMPMVVHPLPWTTPFNGGYLTKDAQGRNALVKSGNLNYLSELADRADEMPAVYTAVNALQDTRWAINNEVLQVAQKLWDLDPDATPMPSREDWGTCQCPSCGQHVELASLNTRHKSDHPCFEDEAVLRQWKQAAFSVHSSNVSLRSQRMATSKTLRVAEIYQDYEAIYFPYQLDFRGRVYALPSFNPQGTDLTKGLLRFADGMAIDDGVAAGWLAIHGANVFGFDKASLEDRIGWVEEHQHRIIGVAEDPINYPWWQTADKPWQFLAFCFEWSRFVSEGYGMVSYLPVALDGTCSGIQHFSAMLRDEVGGDAVNLLPREKPADIYQAVCDKVIEKLERDTKLVDTIAVATFAQAWLSLHPNRKTTKRQVMTLPYGSTRYSCREYTEAWLKEQLAGGATFDVPKEKTFEATRYMSDLIWESISEVVIASRQAMDWLQSCAKVVAKEELPVYWQTPCGFPVMQKYPNYRSKRVSTKVGEGVVKLSLQEELATIDKKRMANAISPNFVHSLDATHLVLSVEMAKENGIDHFSIIHDSFGTHAANTDLLAACLREAFVDLYKDKDVLEDFRQQVIRQVSPENQDQVKPVPAKGNLDVTVVRESDFFFA